ncbi:recombination protein NinB [Escherichia coli]|uniref:recombination protein NinB n=1 Tax=Escherichia coli TaxID=562 RepID=UPI00397D31DA
MKQIYMLRNEAIRNNAIDAILSLPIDDKSPHEVHIKETKAEQSSKPPYVGVMQDVSRQVLWHGQRLAPEDWKDLFTALWLKTKKLEQRSVPGIDGGVVMLGVRTSKMRKASMTELIEIMFGSAQSATCGGVMTPGESMNGHNEKVGLHDYQIKYTSTRQGLLANAALAF